MKNVIKSILFTILLLGILELVAYLLLPQESIKKYVFKNVAIYDILHEQPDTIDVIALGDSLIYSSISPMEIWNQYGYTVFDCAKAAESIFETRKSLEIAIKHEHPKIVFFEANVLFRDPNKKQWYFKLKNKILHYFPITRYHNNWKKIGMSKDEYVHDADKGYIYITREEKYTPRDNMKNIHKVKKIPPDNLKEFEKIIQLCNNNNIKLVLISNPSQISWRYSKHYTAERVAKRLNVEFIDLNMKLEELGIDWTHETKDDGDHLNHSGAKKVSAYLGKYLQETNQLVDKRNDPKYRSWNKASKIYNNHSDNH